MEQKKSKKGLLIAAAAVVAIVILCLGIYMMTRSGTEGETAVSITVTVTHGDGTAREFPLKTKKQNLGDALVEGKVVEDNQSEYGLYILTADGETVDEAKQQWWSISKDGVALMVGASEQTIAEGEHYELTLTVGYDS